MISNFLPLGRYFEGDLILNPDQMEAFMEQMAKKKGNNQFASIKAGLWMTDGKPDIIKYYIDPKIGTFLTFEL